MRDLSRPARVRPTDPVALTIGNFDGVHRGHQAMLARLIEAAEDLRLPPAVLTFDPPSARVLRAGMRRRRALVDAARSKLDAFAQLGVERTYRRALRRAARGAHAATNSSPTCWCAGSTCAGCWSARTFASARARAGDLATLRAAREDVQRRRRCAPSRSTASARRRPPCAHALAAGDLARAAALLGRPYVDQRSRGARRQARPHARVSRPPTSRLRRKPPRRRHLRRARARPGRGPRGRAWPASACARRSPTRAEPLLEVFLFDFDEAIYGRRIDRRVPAQAARRGALRRSRRADATDPRRRGARRAIISRSARRRPRAR